MSDVPALDEAVLRDVCDVLGETDRGLTNREIDSLLAEARIEDPTPRQTSPLVYIAVSKRDRLYAALSRRQRADGRANAPLHFVKLAMRPVRFRSDPDRFDDLRGELNTALAFAGLELTEGGRLRPLERSASTLSEARRRARRLRSQLAD